MIFLLLFALLACLAPDPEQLLGAVVLHEGSHILCAAILSMGKVKLKMGIYGLRLIYPVPKLWYHSIILSLSGPFAGLAFAIMLCRFSALFWFCSYSAALSALNLLPLPAFDGGAVLRAVSERYFLPDTADRICNTVSVAVSFMLFLSSVFAFAKMSFSLPVLLLSAVTLVATLSRRA